MGPRSAALIASLLLAGCPVDPTALEVSDLTFQDDGGAVDVLFVVDDSNSMGGIQTTLALAAGPLVAGLSAEGLDWQIGVVTTDMDDPTRRGRLVGDVIVPQGADPGGALAQAVQVGTAGSQLERGLSAAWTAVTPPVRTQENDGLVRMDARLAVVIVSDEDDCSDEGQLPNFLASDCVSFPESLVGLTEFAARFRGLKDDALATNVHALVETGVTEEFEGCGGNNVGSRYVTLSQRLGGLVMPVCAGAPEMADALVDQLAGRRSSFPLSRTPDPLSIRVIVAENVARPAEGNLPTGELDGSVVPEDLTRQEGWTFDEGANTVRFWGSLVPPLGSAVQIRYVVATRG